MGMAHRQPQLTYVHGSTLPLAAATETYLPSKQVYHDQRGQGKTTTQQTLAQPAAYSRQPTEAAATATKTLRLLSKKKSSRWFLK